MLGVDCVGLFFSFGCVYLVQIYCHGTYSNLSESAAAKAAAEVYAREYVACEDFAVGIVAGLSSNALKRRRPSSVGSFTSIFLEVFVSPLNVDAL